jgi:rhamnosyltransferase
MTGTGIGASVHAVVVSYRPDIPALRALLEALVPQVTAIQIVDNTQVDDTRVADLVQQLDLPSLRLQRLGDNYGIARALNLGVEAAWVNGATHVLLSDQDSLPSPDMVQSLLRAEAELRADGESVGAVGPTYTDAHTGITFPFQVHIPGKFFYGHVCPSTKLPIVEALSLITSGTLIPAAAWAATGPMREDFFIDHVDIEWGHRARAVGLKLFGTWHATMAHRMGDDQLRVWYFGWRRESAYSPLRVYYRVRNFVALCRSPFMPSRWKWRSGWYCTGLVYTQVFYGRQRGAALRMALRGLWDGLRGRLGPFHQSK